MAGKISGLSVAYLTGGLILVLSGYKNDTIKGTLTSLLKGQVPQANPTGAPSVGLSEVGSGASGGPTAPLAQGGTVSQAFSAVENYWIMAGGPPGEAVTAAAIADAESSLNSSAVQAGQPYDTTGWGLWQITPGNSEPQIGIDKQLLNPLTNARAAVAKYKAAGNSFEPWTTYTSGAYLKYLPTGHAAGIGNG